MKLLSSFACGITVLMLFVNMAIGAEKRVAITFDDGPSFLSTKQILAILKEKDVRATFFVIGKNVQRYPELARAIIADGNVIANHSYDHSRFLAFISNRKLDTELDLTEKSIFDATGLHAILFRAPYGYASSDMYKELIRKGYTVVRWSVDPTDWSIRRSAPDIVKIVLKEARPNGIILLHEGHPHTIKALPEIIDALRNNGYQFVTVDQIVGQKPYK